MISTYYYASLPKEILKEKDEAKKEQMYSMIEQTKDGVYTNGMHYMMKTIMFLINNYRFTHIMVAFDQSRSTTFRRQMYPPYKATRSVTPIPLKQQVQNMKSMLLEIGIVSISDDLFEADDVIGSACKKYSKTMPTYVITRDHDYLQLISDNVKLWLVQPTQDAADQINKKYKIPSGLPNKVAEFTRDVCYGEYGVYPEQIPDLKGLDGDKSDNIPGVKGVHSAAAPLLQQFSSLERIYEELHSTSDDKALWQSWKEKTGVKRSPIKYLREGEEDALLSKELATIRYDYSLNFSVDALRFVQDREIMFQALSKYELGDVLGR